MIFIFLSKIPQVFKNIYYLFNSDSKYVSVPARDLFNRPTRWYELFNFLIFQSGSGNFSSFTQPKTSTFHVRLRHGRIPFAILRSKRILVHTLREGSISQIRGSLVDPLMHRPNITARVITSALVEYAEFIQHTHGLAWASWISWTPVQVMRRISSPRNVLSDPGARGRRTFNQFPDSAPLYRVFRRRATKHHRGIGERHADPASTRHNSSRVIYNRTMIYGIWVSRRKNARCVVPLSRGARIDRKSLIETSLELFNIRWERRPTIAIILRFSHTPIRYIIVSRICINCRATAK